MVAIQSVITFVTGNAHKISEFNSILGSKFHKKIVTRKIELPELQGEIDYICKKKCEEAFKVVKGPVLVEDESLCFKALKDLPGPYIKWFVLKLGSQGLYDLLSGYEDKTAEAVCVYGYHTGNENDEVVLFKGEVSGVIVPPRGSRDFGYSPCFQPHGYTQTFAEMSTEEKNMMSHRFKALRLFKEHTLKNLK